MPRIFDVIMGRTKPAQANLDALFGLAGAQLTLQAAESLLPGKEAGVCYKPAAGKPFSEAAKEAEDLLDLPEEDGSKGTFRQQADKYGYNWILPAGDDFQILINRVHVINSTLQDNGYGPQLLCSVFGFHGESAGPGSSLYLVYLYKRGSFYPFMPTGEERRDVESELRLANVLRDDLQIEKDKENWMALWGLPVS